MTPLLTLVLVAGLPEEFDKLDPVTLDADEAILVLNAKARWGGTGHIGNHYLTQSLGDVLGLLHADCRLGANLARTAALIAHECRALTGVVGVTVYRRYVWCSSVQEPTPVSTLDSCAVFIPKSLGLAFDQQTFDSFHCGVEDLCLTAQQRGYPVLVVPGQAEHAGTRHRSDAWQAAYREYRTALGRKWSTIPFQTT